MGPSDQRAEFIRSVTVEVGDGEWRLFNDRQAEATWPGNQRTSLGWSAVQLITALALRDLVACGYMETRLVGDELDPHSQYRPSPGRAWEQLEEMLELVDVCKVMK